MKKIIFIIGFCFPILLSAQSLAPVWQTPKDALKTPESVFYNAKDNMIYVSNIDGKPAVKDGNGFISLLNTNGQIIKLKWVKGLNAPKGMTMKGKYLYVSDIDRVAKIDTDNGTIVKFYPAYGAKFLNDLQVGKDGKIYVTDSQKGAIYILDEHFDRLYIWMERPILAGANGLAWEHGKLLVGVNGHLLKIDPKTKTIKELIKNKGGIDGLVPLGNNKYLVSNWAGKIQIIAPYKTPIIVSNTTAEKINAADLGYIRKQKLVLIPTFFDNRVIAKKLNGD